MNARYAHPRKRNLCRLVDDGFALVIALALLSFIFLLLFTLITFTRVETQVSVQAQRTAQARANALFALDTALGQLQKYAGPDQRVTAPADIEEAGPLGSSNNRYWTGVWRQSQTGSDRSPELLSWLVSGNETDQNINPSITIPDPAPGNNSVWLLSDGSVSEPDQRIKLPKQEFNDNAGNYAWWVSDESTKAHLGLIDPASATGNRPASERIHSFLTAQKTGVGNLPAWQGHFPDNNPDLSRLFSREDIKLLGSDDASVVALESGMRELFHDTAMHSQGLLVDVANGGLKKDLTSWIRGTSSPNAPKDDDYVIPVVEDDTIGIGQWGLVRSYANTRSDGTTPIDPRRHLNTDTDADAEQGIHPVLTYAMLGMGVYAEEEGPLQVHLFPKIIIWNPHSVTIAEANYEVGIGLTTPGDARLTIYQKTTSSPAKLGTLYISKASFDPDDPAGYFRFTLKAPEIPPGASLMFGVSDSEFGKEYDPGNSILTADGTSNPRYAYVKMTLPDSIVSVEGMKDEDTGEIEDAPTFFQWVFHDGDTETDSITETRLAAALRLKSSSATPDWEFGGDYLHLIRRTDQGRIVNKMETPWDHETDPGFVMITEIGMRSSASNIRNAWLAQANYSAAAFRYTKRDRGSGGTPNFIGRIRTLYGVDGGSGTPFNEADPIYITAEPSPTYNFRRSSTGGSLNVVGGEPQNVILREYLNSADVLFSIAQLANVNFSDLDIYPTWALGNSLGNIRVPMNATSDSGGTQSSIIPRVYDLSYLLNQELWDRYYFSTISDSLTQAELAGGYQPPNARMLLRSDAAVNELVGPGAFDLAATKLSVAGAFNVNSTSVAAWKAFLSSLNSIEYDPITREPGEALENPFSRYMQPDVANGDLWSKTYRTLSDSQIDELAQYIVDEVKSRGPFLSMADFVNRRLEEGPHGFKGALQAAIDLQSAENSSQGINYDLGWPNTTDTAGRNVSTNPNVNYFAPVLKGGDVALGYQEKFPWNMRQAFAPAYLTQRDLLATLGPAMTARSDTFVVRAYGDVTDPLTGEIDAQVWCEAVVQRIPEYVDDSLQPMDDPEADSLNDRMGRRFRILSLKWLNNDEV